MQTKMAVPKHAKVSEHHFPLKLCEGPNAPEGKPLSEFNITRDGIVVLAVAMALIERIKWTQEGRGFETQE